MDKKVWLKVIREELGLLDDLATSMIDDAELTKEEVEIAISRSKMVTKEFEMLLFQISEQVHKRATKEEVRLPGYKVPPVADKPVFVVETEDDLLSAIESKRLAAIPYLVPEIHASYVPLSVAEIPPVPEIPSVPEPPYIQTSVPETPFVPPSPSVPPSVPETPYVPPAPSVPPSVPETPYVPPAPSVPELHRSRSIFPTPPREEQAILNIEMKEEDHTLYKALPIKSLKEGLILNDRYLFQRELFHNDKSRLDQTIDALDRLKNIQEAVEYMKANFTWTKSDASEKFVKLVKRRFS